MNEIVCYNIINIDNFGITLKYKRTDVHIYFVLAQDAVYAFLHIKPLAFLFWGIGIDGVMAGYDDPVFLGTCQH